jgi:hypothetical protein
MHAWPAAHGKRRKDRVVIEEQARTTVVDAPSALKGFLLAQQLPRHRCRTAQDAEGNWHVSVPLPDPEALPALLDSVRQWLQREQIAETQVHVGEEAFRLTARDGLVP